MGPGRYEIIRQLACGGMAEVLLARRPVPLAVAQVANGEPQGGSSALGAGGSDGPELVVLKRVLPHLAQEEGFLKMFAFEARIASQLRHPNIVRVLEVGSMEGLPFIAMERLDGGDLLRLLHQCALRRQSLGAAVALGIISGAARGLGYAHRARSTDGRALKIIHRDVSPHNVFVTREGGVKLLDFGIAKSAALMGHTATGQVKGKIAYMSPEQIRAEKIDARSDLWSLGVVLWESLAGEKLFHRDNDAATLHAILNDEIPPVHLPELPELAGVLKAILERDPRRRLGTAEELADRLDTMLLRLGQRPPTRTIAQRVSSLVPALNPELDAVKPLVRKNPEVVTFALGPQSPGTGSNHRRALELAPAPIQPLPAAPVALHPPAVRGAPLESPEDLDFPEDEESTQLEMPTVGPGGPLGLSGHALHFTEDLDDHPTVRTQGESEPDEDEDVTLDIPGLDDRPELGEGPEETTNVLPALLQNDPEGVTDEENFPGLEGPTIQVQHVRRLGVPDADNEATEKRPALSERPVEAPTPKLKRLVSSATPRPRPGLSARDVPANDRPRLVTLPPKPYNPPPEPVKPITLGGIGGAGGIGPNVNGKRVPPPDEAPTKPAPRPSGPPRIEAVLKNVASGLGPPGAGRVENQRSNTLGMDAAAPEPGSPTAPPPSTTPLPPAPPLASLSDGPPLPNRGGPLPAPRATNTAPMGSLGRPEAPASPMRLDVPASPVPDPVWEPRTSAPGEREDAFSTPPPAPVAPGEFIRPPRPVRPATPALGMIFGEDAVAPRAPGEGRASLPLAPPIQPGVSIPPPAPRPPGANANGVSAPPGSRGSDAFGRAGYEDFLTRSPDTLASTEISSERLSPVAMANDRRWFVPALLAVLGTVLVAGLTVGAVRVVVNLRGNAEATTHQASTAPHNTPPPTTPIRRPVGAPQNEPEEVAAVEPAPTTPPGPAAPLVAAAAAPTPAAPARPASPAVTAEAPPAA
ncbi:MAG: protein kinase, partial [Deltaproteobacteria bacterium]|nr:protein kinase [Deltaproteobacteria bacterium]